MVPPVLPAAAPEHERLRLAKKAFETYRTLCFWFLDPDFTVNEATLPIVIAGLRKHGDRAAFQIAAQLE